MTTDPTALQERIARALAQQDGYDPDKHCDEWIMDGMRESAAAILPVLVEVYDEGYEDGQHDAHEHRPWRKSTHPYRQEQNDE